MMSQLNMCNMMKKMIAGAQVNTFRAARRDPIQCLWFRIAVENTKYPVVDKVALLFVMFIRSPQALFKFNYLVESCRGWRGISWC